MNTRFLRTIIVGGCLVLLSISAMAQEETPENYGHSEPKYFWRDKLQRGLTNLATGWLEIPYKTFSEVVFGTRTPFEGLVIGLTVGTAKALERTAIGAFETATFCIPHYEPILKPEYAGLSMSSTTEEFGDPREGLRVR